MPLAAGSQPGRSGSSAGIDGRRCEGVAEDLLTLVSPVEADEAAAASLAELSPWGLRCLAIAVAVGLLVLVSFTAALRRSARPPSGSGERRWAQRHSHGPV